MTFQLRAPSGQMGGYAVDARVWIDEAPVGIVSSLRQPGSVEVNRFAAGAHRYRAEPDGVRHGSHAAAHPQRDGDRRGAGHDPGRRRGLGAVGRRASSPELIRQ